MGPKLYYFSHGHRNYGRNPVKVYPRGYWEFQAVIEGAIGCVQGTGKVDFREQTLWVFADDCPHGWTGHQDKEAEIIVFHLPAPDTVLEREVRNRGGSLAVPIQDADLRWLMDQRELFQAEWARPNECTALRVAHLLSGLSLIVLERSGYQPVQNWMNLDRERVEKALYWYRQNLEQNPGVETVAAAVGVSPVHLRRLFHKVTGTGPKAAFQEIRLGQARQLLQDPRLTVEFVAAQFNFADASSFTRAYRQFYGHPPRFSSQ